jgi:DNA (cytosine-5)-methyltransferase 1
VSLLRHYLGENPAGVDTTYLRWKRGPRRKGMPWAYESATGPHPLRLVDLFSGCGGMTLGIAEAARLCGRPIDIRLTVDFDETALAVHCDNFPKSADRALRAGVEVLFPGHSDDRGHEEPTPDEVRLKRRSGRVDLLVGGPPCQGHSDLNNHTRRADPRNQLYLKMARAAFVLKPNLVVIENVPSVVHDKSRVVDRTADALRSAGYYVPRDPGRDREGILVRMSDLGVPQSRRRHLLLAHRGKDRAVLDTMLLALHERWGFEEAQPRSVGWAIDDLKGKSREPGSGFRAPTNSTPVNQERINWLFDNGKYDLDDNRMRPPCHRNGHSYPSVYGRMWEDRPAPTITSGFKSMGQGRFVHPTERRLISPHEAARIQTFPDFFSFRAATTYRDMTKIIGNAVPPLFMRHVALLYLICRDLLRKDRP